MFLHPEKYKLEGCKHELHDDCDKNKTFTCRYTPDAEMKETFKFFVQAKGCRETKEFTVKISQSGKSGNQVLHVISVFYSINVLNLLILFIIYYLFNS